NEEATTPTSQSVTSSMDGGAFLRQDVDNTKPAPNPGADRNQSGETTIADKLVPSEEAATSQLKLQISEVKERIDQDSTSESPSVEPKPTHDLVREKTGKRSIWVSVVVWDQSGPKLLRSQSVEF